MTTPPLEVKNLKWLMITINEVIWKSRNIWIDPEHHTLPSQWTTECVEISAYGKTSLRNICEVIGIEIKTIDILWKQAAKDNRERYQRITNALPFQKIYWEGKPVARFVTSETPTSEYDIVAIMTAGGSQ